MKRTGLIIIAIIVLSLISLLGYRSYKSTGELQKKRLYEDSIRVADSIAAIEAAEEEYQRQMAIEKEQEELNQNTKRTAIYLSDETGGYMAVFYVL